MQIKIRSYPTHSLEWLKWKWLTILLIILLISIGEDAKATGPLTHFWWEWILFLLPHGLCTTSFLHPWNFSGSWGGLTFHTSGDFPNPGIKLASLSSPALAGGFFTTSASWDNRFIKYLQHTLTLWPQVHFLVFIQEKWNCMPTRWLVQEYAQKLYS